MYAFRCKTKRQQAGGTHRTLTQRRRVNNAHGVLEVLHLHQNAIQDLLVHPVLVEIDHAHLLADALQRRLHAKLLQIGSDETVATLRHDLKVDVLAKAHVARLDLEDLEPSLLVGDAHVELAVEPSGTAERRLDDAGPVARCDDDDAGGGLQPVHQGQELAHDALLDFAPGLVATGRDGIDLVDEDDGAVVVGGVGLGVLECATQVRLGLAGALRDDLRPVDHEEVRAGLGGDGAGHGGLTASTGTREEDSAGGVDPELRPQLGVFERELD